MRLEPPDVTPAAPSSLQLLAAWLTHQPEFGDVRLIQHKDAVRVGDVRGAVKMAIELALLREVVRGACDRHDAGKNLASVLVDALGDRSMLNSLERVGGTLEAQQRDGVAVWFYGHQVPAVHAQADPELRVVLGLVRQHSDNAAVLSQVLQSRMTGA